MEDHQRAVEGAPDLLSRIRVVLCRTRNPLNLGAAARALRSTGIGSFTLVDPHTVDLEAALPVAVHAEDLLCEAQVAPSLDAALAGCALSIATTVRARFERPPLRPRDAIAALSACPGPVALVFGDERTGLHNEEVERCDLVSAIPSDPGQPSWNLAQTIAVYAYEARMASLAGRGDHVPDRPRGEPAHAGQLAHLDRSLSSLLGELGWLRVRRRLSRTLARSGLTEREAKVWSALLLELHKRLSRAPG